MALAWRRLNDHEVPIPCHGLGCPPPAQLPRAPFNLSLSTSRVGAPQLLWTAVPGPHCPLNKEHPPNI